MRKARIKIEERTEKAGNDSRAREREVTSHYKRKDMEKSVMCSPAMILIII